jgi:hypothetical protein
MKMIRTAVGECFLDVLPDRSNIPAVDLPGKLLKKLYCELNTFMECLKAGWEVALQDYWEHYMTGSVRKKILIAVMLNPGVSPEKCLTNDEQASANEFLKVEYDAIKINQPEASRPSRKPRQEVTREDLFGGRTQVDELSEYLRTPRSDRADFDTANWWFDNKGRFPTLFRMTQHYLVIPATSAASERQFSKAKKLKPKKRWSIKPQKLGAMVCICIFVSETKDLLALALERRKARQQKQAAADEIEYSDSPFEEQELTEDSSDE